MRLLLATSDRRRVARAKVSGVYRLYKICALSVSRDPHYVVAVSIGDAIHSWKAHVQADASRIDSVERIQCTATIGADASDVHTQRNSASDQSQ